MNNLYKTYGCLWNLLSDMYNILIHKIKSSFVLLNKFDFKILKDKNSIIYYGTPCTIDSSH